MNLKTQIKLIIFSIFFGIIFSLLSDLNYKIIKLENKIIKQFFTFIFCLIFAIIYFLVLQKINNGALHIYSFICIVISYIFTHFIVMNYKKWYTKIRIGGN